MSMTKILAALTSTFYAESQPLILIFVVKSVKNLGLPVCLLSMSRKIQFKAHNEPVHVITMKRGTRLLSGRKKEGRLTVPLSWCNALMLFQLGTLNLDYIYLRANVNFGLVRIFERYLISLYLHLRPP
jgi:uncharacterized membrane protein